MHCTAFVLCSYFFSLFWHWVTNLILSVLHGPLGNEVQIISSSPIPILHPPTICHSASSLFLMLSHFAEVFEGGGGVWVPQSENQFVFVIRSCTMPFTATFVVWSNGIALYFNVLCIPSHLIPSHQSVISDDSSTRIALHCVALMISLWTHPQPPLHRREPSASAIYHIYTTSFVLCSYSWILTAKFDPFPSLRWWWWWWWRRMDWLMGTTKIKESLSSDVTPPFNPDSLAMYSIPTVCCESMFWDKWYFRV